MRPYLLCLLQLALCAGESVRFPADAGIRDVRSEFGAIGDGVADDTAALRKAFAACSGRHMETVYLPAGTYVVSDTLWFAEWIHVQGEDRARTIIRLKDACAGFGDAARPKVMLSTLNPAAKGHMNMNFSTHLSQVTVDTGTGNPGAIGVEFMSHNGGGIEDATIRSGDGAGAIGLDMRRAGQGPALCRRIAIDGFDVGLEIVASVYSSTFEDLAFSGQRLAAVRNANHPLVMRRVSSRNAVPFLETIAPYEGGQTVILDSDLRDGDGRTPAIRNTAKGRYGDMKLFLRGVRVAGYAAAADDRGRMVSLAEAAGEYRSGAAMPDSPDGARSLGLDIAETPQQPWQDPAGWANVLDFVPLRVTAGGEQGDRLWDQPFDGWDISEALQRAIDSGAGTVYLPRGTYLLRKTITLRDSLRVLQGCGSILKGGKGLDGPVLLRLAGGSGPPLFIDRLSCMGRIEHASPRDLVITHCRWPGFQNAAPADGAVLGRLFADDVCGHPWIFAQPQRAWLRSLNVESGQLKLDNRAGTVWVLGYKTEGGGQEASVGPAAALEILGGCFYEGHSATLPMFTVADGGRLTCTATLFWSKEVLLQHGSAGGGRLVRTGKGARVLDLLHAGTAP